MYQRRRAEASNDRVLTRKRWLNSAAFWAMNLRAVRLMAAAFVFSFASAAPAATLIVDGSGELTGATGVEVGGAFYDVSFVDGTCTDVFSGCDSSLDFAFATSALAQSAAQALLDQVFISTFDASPQQTLGCEGFLLEACVGLIPYGIDDFEVVMAGAFNRPTFLINPDTVEVGIRATRFDINTADEPAGVWAVFTPVSAPPIPEPSTWAMMLLGFGAIGWSYRRRRLAGVRPTREMSAMGRNQTSR